MLLGQCGRGEKPEEDVGCGLKGMSREHGGACVLLLMNDCIASMRDPPRKTVDGWLAPSRQGSCAAGTPMK